MADDEIRFGKTGGELLSQRRDHHVLGREMPRVKGGDTVLYRIEILVVLHLACHKGVKAIFGGKLNALSAAA